MESLLQSQPLLKVGAATAVVAFSVFYYLLSSSESKRKSFLQKGSEMMVPLIQRDELTSDTRRLRFGLPTKNHVLGLPVGKHIKVIFPNVEGVVSGQWNGREDREADQKIVQRSYTPTTLDSSAAGYFDLVIKVYRKGIVDRFPDGGKVSQQLDALKVGDQMKISGPWGRVTYGGLGKLKVSKKEYQYRRIGMIAGGTGITPMLQVINEILSDPEDNTEVSLLFANQTESDILVRSELESLHRDHPNRFKSLHYTLDRAPKSGWNYSEGFVNEDMIRKHLPAASDDTVILCCGPPPMIKFACKPNLEKVGHASERVVCF